MDFTVSYTYQQCWALPQTCPAKRLRTSLHAQLGTPANKRYHGMGQSMSSSIQWLELPYDYYLLYEYYMTTTAVWLLYGYYCYMTTRCDTAALKRPWMMLKSPKCKQLFVQGRLSALPMLKVPSSPLSLETYHHIDEMQSGPTCCNV